jgi:NAD(P)-dependent dehydrogenase (short-subunit alcohol dehydrogenase family)
VTLVFLTAFALYTISRSPGLDEWDSVQFATGLREFNLWKHQPHPPGYPLHIFLAWSGSHALINNAGARHFDPAEFLPVETIASQFQILVFGQIQLMELALSHIHARGEGLIINVTSLASRLPVPFMGAYNAAKAALASFSMSIQLELGNSRVRVVDIQPIFALNLTRA